ncbi:MAG: hypothetical protein FWC89_12685 [Defluviitaleaceae bacterium]|nr:hypothetical protein [Defluviitaleaceae bacterium]
MKIDKSRKIRITVAILGLLILIIYFFYTSLSDPNINGFVGVAGIVRLNFTSDSHVRLTNEPLQILISQYDWLNYVWATSWYDTDLFRSKYFDFESVRGCGHACFRGYREGVRYHVSPRSFTRRYFIITIEA